MTPNIGSEHLERRLAHALVAARAAGAVASLVLDDRERVLLHGEASPGRAMTAATPIHICSCSKTFTAAVFAALVQDGVADWDQPMQQVVPEFRLPDARAGSQCTFRDLAGMRTGLSRDGIAEWGIRQDLPRESRLARAAAMDLAAPFRDRFSYSNLCYITLSLAAERLAGCPYSQLVQERLCAPLALSDTLSAGAVPAPAHAANPYLPRDDSLRPVRELTGANSEGSARIHLSGRDAVRWMRFLLAALAGSDSGPLRAATVAAMAEPQALIHAPGPSTPDPYAASHYGMGLHITRLRGRRLLRHGGAGRGWRHALVLAPEARAGVMLMASAESPMIEGIALDLLDALLGEADAGWSTRFPEAAQAAADTARKAVQDRFPASPVAPASLAPGHYHNAATGMARIETDAGGARFVPEDAPDLAARLRPLGGRTFELDFEEPAMAHQPLDPPFRLRFDATRIETTYFGRLHRRTP